jgi:ASPIC and UnbV
LIGTKSNRDGIGASPKLTSEGLVHVEQAKVGTSSMSASDPRIHFGLGKRTKVESLEITWPSRQVAKWPICKLTNHRCEGRDRNLSALVSQDSRQQVIEWNFGNCERRYVHSALHLELRQP